MFGGVVADRASAENQTIHSYTQVLDQRVFVDISVIARVKSVENLPADDVRSQQSHPKLVFALAESSKLDFAKCCADTRDDGVVEGACPYQNVFQEGALLLFHLRQTRR